MHDGCSELERLLRDLEPVGNQKIDLAQDIGINGIQLHDDQRWRLYFLGKDPKDSTKGEYYLLALPNSYDAIDKNYIAPTSGPTTKIMYMRLTRVADIKHVRNGCLTRVQRTAYVDGDYVNKYSFVIKDVDTGDKIIPPFVSNRPFAWTLLCQREALEDMQKNAAILEVHNYLRSSGINTPEEIYNFFESKQNVLVEELRRLSRTSFSCHFGTTTFDAKQSCARQEPAKKLTRRSWFLRYMFGAARDFPVNQSHLELVERVKHVVNPIDRELRQYVKRQAWKHNVPGALARVGALAVGTLALFGATVLAEKYRFVQPNAYLGAYAAACATLADATLSLTSAARCVVKRQTVCPVGLAGHLLTGVDYLLARRPMKNDLSNNF